MTASGSSKCWFYDTLTSDWRFYRSCFWFLGTRPDGMCEGKCSGQSGIMFIDIVNHLERIGDRAMNIAEAIVGKCL